MDVDDSSEGARNGGGGGGGGCSIPRPPSAPALGAWRRLRFVDLSDTRLCLATADAICAAAVAAAVGGAADEPRGLAAFNARRTPALRELLGVAGLLRCVYSPATRPLLARYSLATRSLLARYLLATRY